MGTVFAIKKYAIHDGPDIRTTVFLKGCPLSCRWCHNPEGMSATVDVVWSQDKCIGCGECIRHCPTSSLSLSAAGLRRDRESCSRCRDCVALCPALAHEATGWEASVAEIMAEISKDLPFYDQSSGGVTFSGGEPLQQPRFLLELLQACGRLGIHRVVDTCAFAAAELLLEVAAHAEMFLIDLKHMDNDRHRLYTGVGNEKIISNIRLLSENGSRMRIRIPLIEGVNADEENIRRSGEFIVSLKGVGGVDLLPYHGAAAGKYRKLGLPFPGASLVVMEKEKIAKCVSVLTDMGLKVQVGG